MHCCAFPAAAKTRADPTASGAYRYKHTWPGGAGVGDNCSLVHSRFQDTEDDLLGRGFSGPRSMLRTVRTQLRLRRNPTSYERLVANLPYLSLRKSTGPDQVQLRLSGGVFFLPILHIQCSDPVIKISDPDLSHRVYEDIEVGVRLHIAREGKNWHAVGVDTKEQPRLQFCYSSISHFTEFQSIQQTKATTFTELHLFFRFTVH